MFSFKLFYQKGSIGDVLDRKVYASFNSRSVTFYGTDDIDFMFPVAFDKFCIIAPKAMKIPDWMAVFKGFNAYVWCLIVLGNSICGYFWYLLKQWTLR